MKKLGFAWVDGALELKVVPRILVSLPNDEWKMTIEFIKHTGKNRSWTIGYFLYNRSEECWELKFVRDRFKDVPLEQVAKVWKALGNAYDVLNGLTEED